jgi:large repetitive protein
MMNASFPAPVSMDRAASRSFTSSLPRNASLRALAALAAIAAFAVPAARAQVSFPATAVGSTSAAQTVTVTASTAGQVQSVAYLTLGAANLDYVYAGSGDACTSANLSKGQYCTVSVVFGPKYPGVRNGAVVLLASGNVVLGTEYVTGIGQGPLAVPVPGTISIAAGQEGEWTDLGDGGAATSADLYLPSGLAIDGAGDLFIADSNHNRIREVIATGANKGNIVTVAGNGEAGYSPSVTTAIDSPLNIPNGIAIDGAGNLYIADTNNNVVREVNLTLGTITTVAGNNQPGYSGDGAAAVSAMLNSPKSVSVDGAGNFYIADTGNDIIREVSGGVINTIAGTPQQSGSSGNGGPATGALLDAPFGVAFDPSGNMYIADSGNNEVRVVSGGNISVYAGTGTAGYSGDGGAATSAQLSSPSGVATDPAGNVYIADARNYVVRRVEPGAGGTITTVAGNNNSYLYNDGKSGYTYGNGQSGEQFSGNGIAAGAPSNVVGAGIYAPYAVAVDATGDLFIAEYYDQIIREVNANEATLFYTPQYWVNQVSPPQNEAIQNIGNQPFTSTSIGTDANAQYASTTNCTSFSLGINDQCTVAAEFAPTTSGNPVVGNVTVNSPGANPAIEIHTVGQALALNQPSITLTSSPNPSNYGQNVGFTVMVTQGPASTQGTPTGTVSFTDTYNGTTGPIGTPQTLKSGAAILNIATLGVGTHDIYATYSGDTYYQTGTSNTVKQVVNEQVTVTLVNSSGNNPSIVGTNVTFQATVTISGGIPITSAVSFYNGTTFLGSASPNAGGVATFTTSTLPLGSDSITATYTDSNSVTGTSKPLIQMVEQQTATALTSSLNPSLYGNSVTFTAVVTATGTVAPTGTVTFYNGTTKLGTGILAPTGATTASATFATTTLPVGTDQITATYGGDTNDFGSTSAALAQVVNTASTTTTLTASANPVIAGNSVTLTATVTATSGSVVPTGTVDFMNGTTLLGTGTLNAKGVATYAATLAVGTYSLTAVYKGDANDTGSTSTPPLSLTVVQATTTTTLTASATTITPSTALVLTATVTGNGGTPTGNVTFMDGANNIGTGTLNAKGVATLTVSNLAVGQHTITAVYAGDTNDAGSTSKPVTITVNAFTTTTVLAASATQIGQGMPLDLVAVIASQSGGAVSGTVTFVSGSTTLGTGTVGAENSASLTLGNLSSGTYTITAQYSGDTNDAPSTSNSVTVTVGPPEHFTVQLSPPSLTIPTKEYGVTNITLTSENGFADTIALGCSSLPFSVTCTFSNNDVKLPANGSTTVQLTVDTNSPLVGGGQAKNEMPSPRGKLLAACALPGAALFGLGFWRFRRRHAIFRVLAVVAMLAGTTFLMNGCGGLSLSSAKAGTYTIQITAEGMQSGVINSANLSVQVTQ